MRHVLHLRRLILIGAILAVACVVGLTSYKPANAQPSTPMDVVREQFDGWEYLATPGQGRADVIVNYDKLTPEGIRAFAAANRRLVDSINEAVPVSIVFQRPLSVDEFIALMRTTKVDVTQYTIRAVDGSGQRITIQGAPSARALVPQDMLDTTLAHINDKMSGAMFKGIVTVDATATPEQLRQLLKDERVFTTDVTQIVAVQHVGKRLGIARQLIQSHLSAPLYWFMENAAIAER